MNVVDRFLHYVSIDTQSDPKSGMYPSTEKQKKLGQVLAEELAEKGASDVRMDDFGYVYGRIPATPGCEKEPVIGLIAHMDTAPDCSGTDVKPRIVRQYDGKDIILNEEKGVIMTVQEFPFLGEEQGKDLIVTDGTTLLGADDKAGVAEIMSAAEALLSDHSIAHGEIAIAFTPDEEIGEGADHFDLKGFDADFAYTVDGGMLGEIEYECFNAASAVVTVHGIGIHTGEAKGKMRNASLVSMEFLSMLPAAERPEHTEGYEGFYHLHHIEGDVETAVMEFLIRDHDRTCFEQRKSTMEQITAYLNVKYGSGAVDLTVTDSYYNMREKIEPLMEIVERAKDAMESQGVTPRIQPIRGGTDGARLSYEGLPCPNLSTGGRNFHGRYEYIPIQSMETMMKVLLHLVSVEH